MCDPITEINPNRVEEILKDCLFKDGEPVEPRVEAEGIMTTWGFHPVRLESHRAEVRAMLDLLPMQFRAKGEGGGGGWSFLNAAVQRVPDQPALPFERYPQWTGLQERMDQLFSLGQGLGYVKPQLPRSMWPMLPGGVPYYMIDLNYHNGEES